MTERFAARLVVGVGVLIALLSLTVPFAAAIPWLFSYAQITDGYRVNSALLFGMPQLLVPLLMLPLLAVQVYGLVNLRQTFAAAARGEYFSIEAVKGFRRFAWATVWMVPFNIIQKSLMLAYVSWIDPEMQNILAVDVGSDDFRALVLAVLFLFVANVFSVGHRVDEDARSIL